MTEITDLAARPRVGADLARSWMLRSPLAHLDSGSADALVIDLEDGLPAERKDEGRSIAADFLQHTAAWVRVNAADADAWAPDLSMAAHAPRLAGVMLAVTESAAQVEATAAALPPGTPVIALIESAVGLERVSSIAAHPATFRLAFGSGDFRLDTGMADDPVALSWPRARMVVASAAARIAPPIDGPASGDDDAVRTAARHALQMGMTGKLVLRDEHVRAVEDGLSPTAGEIADAVALLARAGEATDGSYAPACARAERVLARAAAFGLAYSGSR